MEPHWALKEIAERETPAEKINLWPTIEVKINHRHSTNRTGRLMVVSHRRFAYGLLGVLIIASLLFMVPPARAAVESIVQRMGIFFADTSQFGSNAETGHANVQIIPGTRPPSLSIPEVQAQISFPLLLPTWLPEGLTNVDQDVDHYDIGNCQGCGRQVIIEFSKTANFDPKDGNLLYHANQIPAYGGPLLAETTQQAINVNGQSGLYVHGGWQDDGRGDPKIRIGNLLWDDQIDAAYLTWTQDGVAYLIEAHHLGLKLEDMLRIAETIK